MKKGFFHFVMAFTALLMLLAGCEPSTNRVDLNDLLSPGTLPYIKKGRMIMVSSADSTGQNNDRITVPPGKTATILNTTGPGVISRIWLTVDSRDPYYLRRIVLRIYWDDEDEPSVNVPLGDFFGNGFSYTPYISQYLGMTSGGFICYFPMPFEKSARIEIVNETGQEIYALYYQISHFKFEGYLERDVAYFHARWNRNIRTDYDSNYTLLRTEGRGHIVGANLCVQSYDGTLSFLEGNDVIYIDNETKPSIVGTGTEDYFSSGWYFTTGTFYGPYHGLLLKDETRGRIAAYRHHIPDPISFKKSIRFTFEHGQSNTEIADYSSTVYWYQLEPHPSFAPLPKAGLRIPLSHPVSTSLIEAEQVVRAPRTVAYGVEDMTGIGPDWSKGGHLLLKTGISDTFSLVMSRLFDPSYTAELYFSRGPDYGNISISVDGYQPVAFEGYAPTLQADGRVILYNIQPRHGHLEIRCKVTGKDPASKGYHVALDGIDLSPNRKYIPEWKVLGPFPNPRTTETHRTGLDSVFINEANPDTSRTYTGIEGKLVSWQYVQTPENGYIALNKIVMPNELSVAYALTELYSPDTKDVLFVFGSDDGVKVFLNGVPLFRFLGIRVAEPDQDTLVLRLNKGWNQLMLKIENNLGGYAFYGRIIDPGNTLTYKARYFDSLSR